MQILSEVHFKRNDFLLFSTFICFPAFLKQISLCLKVEKYYFTYLFVFLGPQPRHMEAPRLVVELELQPLSYATATAMPDPSCICDLHHTSRQHWILNPLSEAKDRTLSSWILVRSVSTEPQWELQKNVILKIAPLSRQIGKNGEKKASYQFCQKKS